MRFTIVAFLTAFLALAMTGCPEEPTPCASPSDCTGDQVCRNNQCTDPDEVPPEEDAATDSSSGDASDDANAPDGSSELNGDGESCAADAECASGNCECEDFNCDTRVCAASDCICGYGTSGACENPMTGADDPEDCDGACGEEVGSCDAS